ncbi:hypothetical protein TNCT_682911 [Trichonephila clavata]|uniref:Uncharacterized protein n=1 Tax=Trichonephila clavata TaxID=2740835 RepID=A0A8X6J7E3_TRICU|nr:hypothetical protein TNCT_682911 [Trichonephila clavata]
MDFLLINERFLVKITSPRAYIKKDTCTSLQTTDTTQLNVLSNPSRCPRATSPRIHRAKLGQNNFIDVLSSLKGPLHQVFVSGRVVDRVERHSEQEYPLATTQLNTRRGRR